LDVVDALFGQASKVRNVLAAYQYNESIEVQFGCACSRDRRQQIDIHR